MSVETRQNLDQRGLDRSAIRWLMRQAGNPRIAIRLWNGEEFWVTDLPPVACMEFRERRAIFELLYRPTVAFGECYSRGLIEIHGDFPAFIDEITRTITLRNSSNYHLSKWRSWLYAMRRNTLNRSRHNVHHHYDLGNDFYRLWLDERMVYTCAYYNTPTATLAEAQLAKLDHVCRKLRLQPGQKVVEAGCGWGALSLHMAEKYGVEVVAYNNSREQVGYAREQARARRLEDRVSFVEDDYRMIHEPCDAFVSVGMLEHVGMGNFETLGALIKRVLKPDGFGLIHSIGRSFPHPPNPWIVKHIFPGGHMPSLGEMTSVFEPQRFSILDVENLRLHYARTCSAWLQNFEDVSEQVADMYDEEFVRKWRLYLAGSSAGFRYGTLQLFQIVFTPHGNNRVPLTRNYQYRQSTEPR